MQLGINIKALAFVAGSSVYFCFFCRSNRDQCIVGIEHGRTFRTPFVFICGCGHFLDQLPNAIIIRYQFKTGWINWRCRCLLLCGGTTITLLTQNQTHPIIILQTLFICLLSVFPCLSIKKKNGEFVRGALLHPSSFNFLPFHARWTVNTKLVPWAKAFASATIILLRQ